MAARRPRGAALHASSTRPNHNNKPLLKRRMRNFPPKCPKLLQALAVVGGVYCLWCFRTLSLQDTHDIDPKSMLQHFLRESATRKALRPPQSRISLPVVATTETTATVLEPNSNYDWKYLCRQAQLDRHSRVLIVGSLQLHALPRFLHHTCQVRHFQQYESTRHHRRGASLLEHRTARNLSNLQLAAVPKLHNDPPLTHVIVLSLWDTQNAIYDAVYHKQVMQQVYQFQNLSTMRVVRVTGPHNVPELIPPPSMNVTRLSLQQPVVGPYTVLPPSLQNQTIDPDRPPIYIDEAMVAILQALADPSRRAATIPYGAPMTRSRQRKTQTYQYLMQYPKSTKTDSFKPDRSFSAVYGEVLPSVPCAAHACSSAKPCHATVWDKIAPITQNLTSNCSYVVYMLDLDPSLDHLYEVQRPPPELASLPVSLCRLAFVSDASRLASHHNLPSMQSTHLNGWNVVPVRDTSMTDAELPFIDPSAFLAPSVRKALYTEWKHVASSADIALEIFLKRVNWPAKDTKTWKQKRPGTEARRFLPVPAHRAREAALYVSNVYAQSASLTTYIETIPESSKSKEQLRFYRTYEHWRIAADQRFDVPNDEFPFPSFPYQWISPGLLVHNLRLPAAARLRCEWMLEYASWDNQNQPELSLGFLLGRMRMNGRLGGPEAFANEWQALLDDDGEPLLTESDGEVSIRTLRVKHDS